MLFALMCEYTVNWFSTDTGEMHKPTVQTVMAEGRVPFGWMTWNVPVQKTTSHHARMLAGPVTTVDILKMWACLVIR